MRIIYSIHVLKDSDIRNFPPSPHRSKRIHKKLVKRYGSVYKRIPAMYTAGDVLYAHPFYKKELDSKVSREYDNPLRSYLI